MFVSDTVLGEAFQHGVSSELWELGQDCLTIARVADPRQIKYTNTSALFFERCVLLYPESALARLQLSLVRWLAQDDVTTALELCDEAIALARNKLKKWDIKAKRRKNHGKLEALDKNSDTWGSTRDVLLAAQTAARAIERDFDFRNLQAEVIQRAWRNRYRRQEANGVEHARSCHALSLEWTMCRARIGRALGIWQKSHPNAEQKM
jgi:hypothetical protein